MELSPARTLEWPVLSNWVEHLSKHLPISEGVGGRPYVARLAGAPTSVGFKHPLAAAGAEGGLPPKAD
jgi:hypothetical protein